MKIFKDEVVELYKMYFQHMKVREFDALETIPDGVSKSEMENLAMFIKNIKEANAELNISEYKIGEIIEAFTINNYKELEYSK